MTFIEDIQIGDTVIAYDETQKDTILSRVTNTFAKSWQKMVRIVASGDTITATNNHPFYLPQLGKYLRADSLRQNMKLLALTGALLTVHAVEAFDTTLQVYNFEVEEYHNYFVGEEGVLVHNDCILFEAGLRSADGATDDVFDLVQDALAELGEVQIELGRMELRSLLREAPNRQELKAFFRGDDLPANMSVADRRVVQVRRVRAWETLYHPTDIPEAIRTNVDNLEFVADYLSRFPNEAGAIKNGLANATNKQNWLELFELEDIVKVDNLIKGDQVIFTLLEEIPWSKEYVVDLVDDLSLIRLEMGDVFGRWDEIQAKVVTVNPHSDFPDFFAIASNETVIFTNGSRANILNLNIANLARFDSYDGYLNHIRTLGENNEIVAHNIRDVLHHELAHALTTPNSASYEFEDLYETYSALLQPLSDNALTNADEALAEIFTAYQRGEPVDEDLLEFFNDYSIPDFPDLE
ncbi:polymorphic toxin-type HINT domain-containing protein [Lewinella sp. LCG006]|uniref:polymorphic toxin-type HINT domain-containing protein n=1 Tax=Lewinella sp. LCG006 TaxID=3231911 RepID=UPI00345FAD9F